MLCFHILEVRASLYFFTYRIVLAWPELKFPGIKLTGKYIVHRSCRSPSTQNWNKVENRPFTDVNSTAHLAKLVECTGKDCWQCFMRDLNICWEIDSQCLQAESEECELTKPEMPMAYGNRIEENMKNKGLIMSISKNEESKFHLWSIWIRELCYMTFLYILKRCVFYSHWLNQSSNFLLR